MGTREAHGRIIGPLASPPRACHPLGVSAHPSRRDFVLFTGALLTAACRTRTPSIPTRAAPTTSSPALGKDLQGELLDTEDGVIPIDANDPQRGPRDAFAVLVVFSDFQCPFCRDMAGVLERLRNELPKKVRVVFKHLPIPSHPNARTAAVAAQVVFLEAGSDAFWRFHDRCFAHPHDLDSSRLATWARDEGVKAEAIASRGPEADTIVSQHMALAERMGIRGTPRLYINQRRVNGFYPYEQIREWVDEWL